MNPYLVPGLVRADGPLCPFQEPDHETYYVPVDNTQNAYEQFQEEIGDPRNLITEGRLVVVSGEQLCGKSALINRCAAWLKRKLGDVGLLGEVFSLTGEGAANHTVEARILRVFNCMIDDLRGLKLLKDDQLAELADRKNDLDMAFRYLSTVLRENRVLIVILPPSEDLIKEAVTYAKFSRGKIVFFIESAFVDTVRHHWPTICEASRIAPILLEVGPLDEGDGWRFAEARQDTHAQKPDVGPFPKLTRETIHHITQGMRVTIGQLQNLLYGYYQHQISQQDMMPLGEVTAGDLGTYYLRLSLNNTRKTR